MWVALNPAEIYLHLNGQPQTSFSDCLDVSYSCIFNILEICQPKGLKPAVVPDLLSVVYERVVGVDKEDVLRLQVCVSQLVVMENCRAEETERGGEERESAEIYQEPTPSSGEFLVNEIVGYQRRKLIFEKTMENVHVRNRDEAIQCYLI